MERRTRNGVGVLLAIIVMLSMAPGTSWSSMNVDQSALPGGCIPQFAVPMPVFGPAGPIPRVDASEHPALTVEMVESEQRVLPDNAALYNATYFDLWTLSTQACPSFDTSGLTRVWAYKISDSFTHKLLAPANWPAVTVDADRFQPTLVKYVNSLPAFDNNNPFGPGLVQGLISIDKTLHWADPINSPGMNTCMDNPAAPGCSEPFVGPPPATAHLHGGEVSSLFDGGPTSWFTPDGKTGPGYASLWTAGPGKAIYLYPNAQEPGTLWFHDHALGATRTNVYSGMAAFYFLRDPAREPKKLPKGPYEIEMAIQDRQFDNTGQLFFPDGSGALCGSGLPGDPCLNGAPGNPTVHPFWIPEFVGDVMVVNGAPWPVLNVEARRYRFRLLDGCNARFLRMKFGNVPIYAIGADDSYLDSPVRLDNVFIAPGERLDVIADFSGFEGQDIDVTNDAPMPFPEGLYPVEHPDPVTGLPLPADQPQMSKVMRFHVVASTESRDRSCDPAQGECGRPKPLARLSDGQGGVAPGLVISKKRQLTLKEFEDPVTGTPVIVLVNNTYWDGKRSPSIDLDFPFDGISELPQQGSVEEWEIINLTTDAHPMHTHLAQFQILNRQDYDADGTLGFGPAGGYLGAWFAAFGTGPAPLLPGCTAGSFCPGYGPPLDYLTANADNAIGGNPAISPFLVPGATPPGGWESGWKDTGKALPRSVTRLLVRWTPTSAPMVPNATYAGKNLYPFDPTQGDGYVWHCHIIDHEDNEMMRPYRVQP